MKTDEDWMDEYKEGNEKAFEFLYEKYSPLVWSYIKRRIRPSEASDLYQKVWQRLHEKRELYSRAPFAPWFFVLIKNLIVDEYRSLSRKNRTDLKEELIEKIYSGKEDLELDEILKILPPDTQKLVKNYYLEGVSYEELEEETGLSQTNLRKRLSRAMSVLRKSYEK